MVKEFEDGKENNNPVEEEGYTEFVKSSVNDGSYFQDALDWYCFRYLSPICDRTLLIFGAIVAAVILFFLVQMVQSAFPLVQKVPIFITAKDKTLYFPHLVELKPKEDEKGYDPAVTSIDDAVLKYLVSVYVKDREAYNFSAGEIEAVNKKINRVRNVSSPEEYRIFQAIMSEDNPESPIRTFGKDVVKTIKVESVTLVKKEPKTFTEKAKEYISVQIPTQAEVRFTATTTENLGGIEEKITKERYLARVDFNFTGVDKDQKKGSLDFVVNGYKLFKVK